MSQGIAQLSAAMAVGDSTAVEAFYREYFDWMYGQARRITGRDESFCLDVVQDAVLRVIRTVRTVDSEARFRAWVRLVVQTTAFDLLRNERRRKNREAMAGVADVGLETDALQLDWLAEQIARLDPEIVRIIELRFEQSWTLRRIGEKLGMTVGAVDGRLRRALRSLALSDEDENRIAGASRPGLESAEKPEPDQTAHTEAQPLVSGSIPDLQLQRQVAAEAASPVEVVGVRSRFSGDLVGSASGIDLEDEAGAYDDRL